MKLDPIFEVDDDCILDPNTIAEILQVSEETARRWCRTGVMDAYAPGGHYIVSGAAFKQFLRESRPTAKWDKRLPR
ncbi:helix-turn-helix domain-containing protein [Alicyclobacillus sp. SO9]|uniref:helix-turn-helix domain-containing protein n=1 Tax=Alicyclobacillus sp. SO9 TaxID=2665646 RepID=UPI0018E9025C|nr:helix-turn-helix domain-containing protein [Alicyclobacillus sp. SO9]QQE80609.1 helix-turn-helix domain-containing protein [Alicyclobacillus sp. SO9]